MSVTKITTHISDALGRLLEQYKYLPNIRSLIEIYAKQIQLIEDAAFELFTERALLNASGAQLDLIGAVVGQAREGATDSEYRVLINVRIGTNISEGEIPRVISVFKLLTGSDYVHLINLQEGSIQLMTTVDFADQDEVNLVYINMQKVVAGGVRIDHILCADPTEAFAYAGSNADAPGLGYDDGAGSGGLYAIEHIYRPEFAYAGSDPTAEGYGSFIDPLAGGVYAA
jgi:hypothetical protein